MVIQFVENGDRDDSEMGEIPFFWILKLTFKSETLGAHQSQLMDVIVSNREHRNYPLPKALSAAKKILKMRSEMERTEELVRSAPGETSG